MNLAFELQKDKRLREDSWRESRKKMPYLLSILGIVAKPLIDWWLRLRARPVLRLIHHVYPDVKFIPGLGIIRLLVENSGHGPGTGLVIDLFIYEPQRIYPGQGLLFTEGIGRVEQPRSWLPGNMIEDTRPNHYRFRLSSEIFINPSDEPLEIATLPVAALDCNKQPERLNYDMKWKISCKEAPPKTGRITYAGPALKRILLSNVPLPYREPPLG